MKTNVSVLFPKAELNFLFVCFRGIELLSTSSWLSAQKENSQTGPENTGISVLSH